MSGRDYTISTWNELIEKLRERFLPPEGEMRVVGQWRRLQQTGSVASYADYVFWLKALYDMGEAAEFKLAFFGLQPELQAEVREYLRQNRVRQLELEKLFAVAQDAEVGLTGRAGRRGHLSQDRMTEKTGHKKQGGVMANSVLLDPGNAERPRGKKEETEHPISAPKSMRGEVRAAEALPPAPRVVEALSEQATRVLTRRVGGVLEERNRRKQVVGADRKGTVGLPGTHCVLYVTRQGTVGFIALLRRLEKGVSSADRRVISSRSAPRGEKEQARLDGTLRGLTTSGHHRCL